MPPMSQIMRENQIAYHSYADDTQLYLALSTNDYNPIDSLCQCIDEVNSWITVTYWTVYTLILKRDTEPSPLHNWASLITCHYH